jgi:predicted metal-dependent hydrolase
VKSSFVYGEDRYEFEICFTPERLAKIAIHVHPVASVQVEAPKGETVARIHRAVLKRARWIKQHVDQARTKRVHVLPRGYVSGESHFYLGRRHQLKVVNASRGGGRVKLLRGRICVQCSDRAPRAIRDHLIAWYRERAAEIFARRVGAVAERINWLEQAPPLRLLKMKKQWGSCAPNGTVFLNPQLVKAPRECIDYVIAHELCHLREHNHSARYYRLLRKVMPQWEPVKARLDGMAELHLNE